MCQCMTDAGHMQAGEEQYLHVQTWVNTKLPPKKPRHFGVHDSMRWYGEHNFHPQPLTAPRPRPHPHTSGALMTTHPPAATLQWHYSNDTISAWHTRHSRCPNIGHTHNHTSKHEGAWCLSRTFPFQCTPQTWWQTHHSRCPNIGHTHNHTSMHEGAWCLSRTFPFQCTPQTWWQTHHSRCRCFGWARCGQPTWAMREHLPTAFHHASESHSEWYWM